MPEWGWSLVGAIGAPLIIFIWQALLKRESTENFGRRIGRLVTIFLRQKLGITGGNTVRDRFQSTVEDFTNGLKQGLHMDER